MQLGLTNIYNHMKSNHASIKSKIKLVKTESSVSYTKCTYSQSIIQSLTNNSSPNVYISDSDSHMMY